MCGLVPAPCKSAVARLTKRSYKTNNVKIWTNERGITMRKGLSVGVFILGILMTTVSIAVLVLGACGMKPEDTY